MSPDGMLGVVLIARDQAGNIDRLVNSVRAETDLRETDIVLVDSASTDATVARARAHPIRVLRLEEGQRLTAAAARQVGWRAVEGEHVLFLDGDMELVPGWIGRARGLLDERDDIGVVGGIVVDRPPGGASPELPSPSSSFIEIRHPGGAALYRRSVLDAVGGFNPYLYSDEEPELCIRIRRAGFRVVRLAAVVALHHSAPERAFSSMLARRRRRLYLGSGQALRSLLGGPGFTAYARERGYALAPALVVLLVGATVIGSALTRDSTWLEVVAGLLLAGAAGAAIRKRSLRVAGQSVLHRLFILEGTIRGFLLEPHDLEDFRPVTEVVQ